MGVKVLLSLEGDWTDCWGQCVSYPPSRLGDTSSFDISSFRKREHQHLLSKWYPKRLKRLVNCLSVWTSVVVTLYQVGHSITVAKEKLCAQRVLPRQSPGAAIF